MLLERGFAIKNPALRSARITREVRRQQLRLTDRQRDDDHKKNCDDQQQSGEDDSDRERFGHTPLQAYGNRMNAERNESGDYEDGNRSGNVLDEPKDRQNE